MKNLIFTGLMFISAISWALTGCSPNEAMSACQSKVAQLVIAKDGGDEATLRNDPEIQGYCERLYDRFSGDKEQIQNAIQCADKYWKTNEDNEALIWLGQPGYQYKLTDSMTPATCP